jgi:hypothetical protein
MSHADKLHIRPGCIFNCMLDCFISGSLLDPDDFLGLAHFLEHMVGGAL